MTKRRNFTAEDKVNVIRQHLIDKKPISDICDEYHIKPTQFYQWQKMFFENGANAFQSEKSSELKQQQQKNANLKELLTHKDKVIAQITEEYVRSKKKDGLL